MRGRRSVGSVFWGLILVAVGGLLLAANLGYSLPVWGALARYWPVLIIAWGLLKLIDYYRLQNEPDKRPLFSGGEVAMLIFVIFAGSAMTAAANISPDIGQFFDFGDNFDFWDLTGSTYQYTEHHELAVSPGAAIRIYNLRGSVDVKPSDGDKITVDVEKSVRAASREDADRREKDFTFSIKDEGGVYSVVSNRDDGVFGTRTGRLASERARYKSNLVIRVPRKSRLDLRNKYGSIAVDGLEGNQTVDNKYGSTSIHDITGAVTLTTGYGAVVVDNVTSDATVTNGYASTTLKTIGGKVSVENKYGAVDIQDVKGDASIANRYSVVNAQRITGSLTVKGRNNSVDVEDVGGTLDVETSYKNLSVRNIKGKLTLANRHGNVDIELEQAPNEEITVNAQYSDVSITVPAGSAFSFDGQTRYGDIDSEFDFPVNSSGRSRSVRGQQGSGGPRITVETQHGNIRLDKRG